MRKQLILIAVVALALAACKPAATLYNWGDNEKKFTYYDDATMMLYGLQTPEALCALLCTYEQMVSQPVGTRQVPPPGICAEYAYFLSLPSTVEAWASTATPEQKSKLGREDFDVYAKELFEREITLYPEATHFIKPLIDKLLNR